MKATSFAVRGGGGNRCKWHRAFERDALRGCFRCFRLRQTGAARAEEEWCVCYASIQLFCGGWCSAGGLALQQSNAKGGRERERERERERARERERERSVGVWRDGTSTKTTIKERVFFGYFGYLWVFFFHFFFLFNKKGGKDHNKYEVGVTVWVGWVGGVCEGVESREKEREREREQKRREQMFQMTSYKSITIRFDAATSRC